MTSVTVNSYVEGSIIRLSAVFKDENGDEVNPAAVFCDYQIAQETKVTLTYGTDVVLVNDSPGHYHTDVNTTGKNGTLTYRFYSTGVGQTAAQSYCLITRKLPN